MKRNIAISKEPSDITKDKVNFNDLNIVVNHSVDLLMCDTLEEIEDQNLANFIKEILQKIRLSGYCAIKILDVKKICSNFLTNKISNTDFISFFNQKANIVSLDIIYSFVNAKEFSVAKLEQQENYISIVLQRISL